MSLYAKLIFEWDPDKARRNRVKHQVSFELAREVWKDPLHVILPDRTVDGEERWHAVGMVGAVAVLVVVHTYPRGEDEQVIRIIGARKATSHERWRYEQQAI
ncbi:BrnT family toxin [Rhizobium oryzicola]|uniref:BrnT family toxin n=1 Tax=Rhizobium oryzicola TaxID=1232668 RepID=A0ABT8SSF9_9HYPH|nr:BrnT family toxin [Rhizobium oryzicola]MDO1581350.1 BrnT family toxin [Rhizobium oryzicola]